MLAQLIDLAKHVLKIIPIAAPVPGAVAAASLAHQIITTCEDVSYQRERARAIGKKCLELEDAIEEASHGMVGTLFQQRGDEFRGLLGQIHKRAQRWRGRPRIVQWYLRSEMNAEMDRFTQELDTALSSFSVRFVDFGFARAAESLTGFLSNQADVLRNVNGVQERAEYHYAETRDLLLKMAEEQADIKKMMTSLSQAGFTDVAVLVRNGQMALKQMREESKTSTSAPTDQSSSVQAPSDPNARQKYRNMQRGLAKLVREAGILPPEKCLDGDVRQVGDMAVAGGSASDIWKGTWLEETEVALKALRHVRVDNVTAQRRIVREIDIWSKLSNEHILQFCGYVTDLGPHLYLVSPWLNNGSVLEYINAHPDADKMHLLRGAAEGLRYLHTQEIIHGNIKCSNIMVSDSGEACISDFGMAKMIEEMTRTPLSTTIARSGSTRWLAPEIVNADRPSKASDTYSFGMAILELLTGKHPFFEHKSDAAVIKAITVKHEIPKRPEGPDVQQWLSDDLWELLVRCWAKKPEARPTMEDVVAALNR